MESDSAALVVGTDRGLYCPPGDFYIDPSRPVQTALITHAHGDHLRHGSARYILARPGLVIARHRLGSGHVVTPVDYGCPFGVGAARVSLHPAGHILGSAQVRIEHAGEVWVVSGDYKRQPDPTCAPFEQLQCDVFVSEASFARPEYHWSPTSQVLEQIVSWWRANRDLGVASVLFCYALGKAQRVLAELRAFTDGPVYLHGAVDAVARVYRRAGVDMVPTLAVASVGKADWRGALIVAPPGAARTPWLRRFGAQATGFCSGWMCVPDAHRRGGYDRGFALSDHADWPGLLDTCLATGARRVLLTHGDSDALSRHLNERGIHAAALGTAPVISGRSFPSPRAAPADHHS
jgi:putative mRNA 3-end processing factor